jgi:hypothetical protein
MSTRPRLSMDIHLGDHDKARAYTAGSVVAYCYPTGDIPDDTALSADLLDMATLLQRVYRAEARRPVPGDPAPEIAAAERAVQALAGRRVPPRSGFSVNAKQRQAIEMRAMRLATEYFEGHGAMVRDVSANNPFDLEVELGGQTISVEVKGTASDGKEVLLTRGEVTHHATAYPSNALVIVSNIELEGPPDAPGARGGDLRLVQPWCIEPGELTALSYRYRLSASMETD